MASYSTSLQVNSVWTDGKQEVWNFGHWKLAAVSCSKHSFSFNVLTIGLYVRFSFDNVAEITLFKTSNEKLRWIYIVTAVRI